MSHISDWPCRALWVGGWRLPAAKMTSKSGCVCLPASLKTETTTTPPPTPCWDSLIGRAVLESVLRWGQQPSGYHRMLLPFQQPGSSQGSPFLKGAKSPLPLQTLRRALGLPEIDHKRVNETKNWAITLGLIIRSVCVSVCLCVSVCVCLCMCECVCVRRRGQGEMAEHEYVDIMHSLSYSFVHSPIEHGCQALGTHKRLRPVTYLQGVHTSRLYEKQGKGFGRGNPQSHHSAGSTI